MTIEHIREMPTLKQHLLKMLFDDVSGKRHDKRWYDYKKEFMFEGKHYLFEIQYQLDNYFLTFRHFHIEHKQVVIDIHELQDRGLLN